MRIISWFITLFLLLLSLGFTVKNNDDVALNFWPSSLTFTMPAALWVFGFLFIGLLLGSLLTWLSMLRYRLEAHGLRKEKTVLQTKLEEKALQSDSSQHAVMPSPLVQKRIIPWLKK